MKEKILKELAGVENRHNVKIILACESGSRAWGFPSMDSDYDVRFIYVHQMDWYLSIAKRKDVIELPLDKVLDINGWDLHKSLQLMRKSNSPLMEWLRSPIRYRVWPEALDLLMDLSQKAFLPETSCHHYLAMAKTSLDKFINTTEIKAKLYMYVVRSLLCCQWIVSNMTPPPVQFEDLMEKTVEDLSFKNTILDLIRKKEKKTESFHVKRIDMIDDFIHEKLQALPQRIPKNPSKTTMKREIECFDDVFRSILRSNTLF